MGYISVPQDLSSLGRSSSLLDKVANLLCKIILKHLESLLTIIINELEIIIDSVLVLRQKYIYIYIYFLFCFVYFILCYFFFYIYIYIFDLTSILPKLLYCIKRLLLLV